jgi:glycosyltransferase involved in cell wall biosynthesis
MSRRLSSLGQLKAVIASSTYPLDIFPAWLISRRAKARLIFEVHDLWPLSPIELGGYSRYHPLIMVIQAAENFAYRHADKVVSMLPKTLSYMLRHGLQPSKFTYIPNGIEVQHVGQEEPREATQLNLLPRDAFIIGYAGTIGVANSMGCFVAAAEILRALPKVLFVLMGDGPEAERLRQVVRFKGLPNVLFIDTVPKNHIRTLLKRFDVCYIGLKAEPLYRFGISPNKMFDYMYAARPVLQAVDAGNDLVAEAKCGISVAPEDPCAVANAILAFYHMSVEERQRMGENGRRYVLAHHTYDKLAKQFAELFEY